MRNIIFRYWCWQLTLKSSLSLTSLKTQSKLVNKPRRLTPACQRRIATRPGSRGTLYHSNRYSTPSIRSSFSPWWREAPWELSVLPKNTTQCPWWGLDRQPRDLPICSPADKPARTGHIALLFPGLTESNLEQHKKLKIVFYSRFAGCPTRSKNNGSWIHLESVPWRKKTYFVMASIRYMPYASVRKKTFFTPLSLWV